MDMIYKDVKSEVKTESLGDVQLTKAKARPSSIYGSRDIIFFQPHAIEYREGIEQCAELITRSNLFWCSTLAIQSPPHGCGIHIA